jgi:putative ABC transport system permease protein
VRGLSSRPGFAAAAILTVALGVAAATAVFSVVDATIFRALKVPDQDRVVIFSGTFARFPGQLFQVSQAEFADLRGDMNSVSGHWVPGSSGRSCCHRVRAPSREPSTSPSRTGTSIR